MARPFDPVIRPARPPERRWVRPALVGVSIIVLLVLVGRACGSDDDGEAAPEQVPDDVTATATTTPVPTAAGPEQIVGSLQSDLTQLGHYAGPISGIYDEPTEAALRAFQESVGVSADGVFGPQTAVALAGAVVDSDTTSALQVALSGLCHYAAAIDGDYGPATTGAVTAFQVEAGLDPDGLYGPATAEALVAAWPDRPAACDATTTPAIEDDASLTTPEELEELEESLGPII